ncbi:hypothetical protein GCM10023096_19300 [Nonomuraea ferruginea]
MAGEDYLERGNKTMKRVIFDVAALIARVVIGVIFVAHGLQKWTAGLGAISAGFTEMGVPLPQASAAFATIVEVVCGVLLIVGLAVRISAALLLIDMIGALLFVHAAGGVFVTEGGWELVAALGAACLLLIALGGGRIGLDGIIHAVHRRRSRRAAATEPAYEPVPGGLDNAPTRPTVMEEPQRDVPPQGSGASGLDDRDMRDVDRLLGDEPTRPNPRKP